MGCCSTKHESPQAPLQAAPSSSVRPDTPHPDGDNTLTPNTVHHGRIIRVVDGDTYEVNVVSYGPCMVRMLHVQAPETRMTSGVSQEEKAMGVRLREHMTQLLGTRNVRLRVGPRVFDKYKRLLAAIEVEYAHDYVDIGGYLLRSNLAKPYDKGKPPHFSNEDIAKAVFNFAHFEVYAVAAVRGDIG
jgi:endonuclease YncB( thermonuclease family)